MRHITGFSIGFGSTRTGCRRQVASISTTSRRLPGGCRRSSTRSRILLTAAATCRRCRGSHGAGKCRRRADEASAGRRVERRIAIVPLVRGDRRCRARCSSICSERLQILARRGRACQWRARLALGEWSFSRDNGVARHEYASRLLASSSACTPRLQARGSARQRPPDHAARRPRLPGRGECRRDVLRVAAVGASRPRPFS